MVTVRSFVPAIDRMRTPDRELGRVFDQVWSSNGTTGVQLWYPATDVVEKNDSYVITLELPGVPHTDVDVSFEKNTLTVRGSKPSTLPSSESEELRVFTAERLSGTFERSFRLPQHVDADAIRASFDLGVLTITVPKQAKAQPRKIAIDSAVAEPRKIEG
jgi:HSP20 family protein